MTETAKRGAFFLEAAQGLEEYADAYNRRIAYIASVPYAPNRADTGTAHGIRLAAQYLRDHANDWPPMVDKYGRPL
jgi:hypothetical protein